ncbi:MAG: hypothetical protein PHV61_07330 [Limnochordia bacterium]|jgi:hypothetical protein|nr:hypothetical protein [Limnochordia bacterium]
MPTHHRKVDKQPNIYTAADLRQWEYDLERWVERSLAAEMNEVSFTELESVCTFLTSPHGATTSTVEGPIL